MKTIATGSQFVIQYEGVIPKSGASVFDFASHRLCHRSIKKDKSDYIIHIDTKTILLAMPIGSERSIALNYMAKNIDKIEHFISSPESYDIVVASDYPQKEIKETQSILELVSAPHNISHKDVTRVFNTQYMLPIKKQFNVGEATWQEK